LAAIKKGWREKELEVRERTEKNAFGKDVFFDCLNIHCKKG
jgi:hypothetical protein